MNEIFDWRQAIANLPAPPDPEGAARKYEELKTWRDERSILIKLLTGTDDVPKSVLDGLRNERDEATRQMRQFVWREKNFCDPEDRKGIGMTLHLRPSEIACLDWIARRLYFANPCTENDEPSNFVPSRAQAIRDLIANYMERRGAAYIPMDEMIATQEAWGLFWIREASYRRAGVTKKAAGLVKPPRMPAL